MSSMVRGYLEQATNVTFIHLDGCLEDYGQAM